METEQMKANETLEWVKGHFDSIREEYFAFLRFKTVGVDPSCSAEMSLCANWLSELFKKLQCHSELLATSGFPIVYAEDLSAGPSAPTLLIYGHYDVQPVDPLEEWKSDPFEPLERDGVVYARGATDDKGQILFAISALKFFRQTSRPLPVNLKFCIEGEEENGSGGLLNDLSLFASKLEADYLLVVDFDMQNRTTPSINLGARGITCLDVCLKGSKNDLHSGLFGGIAYNPNRAMVELLAQLWDDKGRVQIPHFYDEVEPTSVEDHRLFPDSMHEEIAEAEEIHALGSPEGTSLKESGWFLPTVEINGLSGGYAGPGFKSVIPAEAHAKISCRLVLHQDPKKILASLMEFLKKRVKEGVLISFHPHQSEAAYRGSSDSKLAIALRDAYEELFPGRCRNALAGGSIPVIAQLKSLLKADVVGMGYGLPSDLIHAPNEHFELSRFQKGVATIVRAIERLGSL